MKTRASLFLIASFCLAFATTAASATALGNNSERTATNQESTSDKPHAPVGSPIVLIGLPEQQAAGLTKSLSYGANSPESQAARLGAHYWVIDDYDKAIKSYIHAAQLPSAGVYLKHSYYSIIATIYEDKLGDYVNAYFYFDKYIDAIPADSARNADDRQERLLYLRLATSGRYYEASQHAQKAMEAELAWWSISPAMLKQYPHKQHKDRQIRDKWQPRIQALEERARAAGQVTAASQKNIVPE